MRNYIIFGTTLLMTTTVLAFSGVFGGKHKSHSSGVDTIGVHFNGKEATIKTSCPAHSLWDEENLSCLCKDGYVMTEDEECQESLCSDFVPTDCAAACDALTGEITYNTLCHNDQYYCDADSHECINPCSSASYNECQVCTPNGTDVTITNNDGSLCPSNNNYVCQGGSCVDPCSNQESSTCFTYTAQSGQCQQTINTNAHCDTNDSHKICGELGNCNSCEDGYELYGGTCASTCGTHQVRNPSGQCVCATDYVMGNSGCVINRCLGFIPTDCAASCDPVTGTITYNQHCNNGNWNCDTTTHQCVNPCSNTTNNSCVTYTAVNGECQQTINTNAYCDLDDPYRICGTNGNCTSCRENYTYNTTSGKCLKNCGEHQVHDQNGDCVCNGTTHVMDESTHECVENKCYHIFDTLPELGIFARDFECVESCDPVTGTIVARTGDTCHLGSNFVCNANGYCGCPAGMVQTAEGGSCVEDQCASQIAANPCIANCNPETGEILNYFDDYTSASCGENKICSNHECVCADGYAGSNCTDCADGYIAQTYQSESGDYTLCQQCPSSLASVQSEGECSACFPLATYSNGVCSLICPELPLGQYDMPPETPKYQELDSSGRCCDYIEDYGMERCCRSYRTDTESPTFNNSACCPVGQSPNLEGTCVECGQGKHYNLTLAQETYELKEGTLACGKICKTNAHCAADEFCYMDVFYTAARSDVNPTIGTCVSFANISDGIEIQPLTVNDQPAGTWLTSRISMNWWSARNFCLRYGNVDLPTRTQLCGSDVGEGGTCSSDLAGGLSDWLGGTIWLESTADNAYLLQLWDRQIMFPEQATGRSRPNSFVCGPVNPAVGSYCAEGKHWDANHNCVCDNNGTAYCAAEKYTYGSIVRCMKPACCAGPVAYDAGYQSDLCCAEGETTYCTRYTCKYENEYSSECTMVCEKAACCNGSVLQDPRGAGELCVQTYCTAYNNQNQCTSHGACAGTIVIPEYGDNAGHETCHLCSNGGGEPYCSRVDENDPSICREGGCCNSTPYYRMGENGADLCCSYDEQIQCQEQDYSTHTCLRYGCYNPNNSYNPW